MTKQMAETILLVDDEQEILDSLELTLNSGGYGDILKEQDSRKVLPLLSKKDIKVALLDLTMPHIDGQELLVTLSEQFPEISVLIVTGVNELETAVDCMKKGAFDYLVKPVEKMRLLSAVQRAVDIHGLARENRRLKKRLLTNTLENPKAFAKIITADPAMFGLFQYIEAVAASPEPVMITGETGVGKELVARAIHAVSGLSGPFIAVNAAGLDDHHFSDTLFGHKKGAFTGADSKRQGLVAEASHGTLFLDEIGDLSLPSQMKLLRLIQEREYYALGSDLPQSAQVRILAASNQTFERLLESGVFRRDLYYRLKRHHVHVPPLRDRLHDLPLLVEHIAEHASNNLGISRPALPKGVIPLMATYTFPGNIRELEAMIIDAVSRAKAGSVAIELFAQQIKISPKSRDCAPVDVVDSESLFETVESLPSLKEASRLLVIEAMKRAQGNQTIAARLLGISQPALSKRLKAILTS